MKHVENIKKLLRTMHGSERFHALVVVSPPGWAKSTTVDAAIAELGIEHHALGAYTSPLALYNSICGHPTKLLVLDDCAGLFRETNAMAVLKAATWPSVGNERSADGKRVRRVAWNSTSDRVTQGETVFSGKLVLLTNVLPGSAEAQAFFSRAVLYRIELTREDVKEMLLSAAASESYFDDTAAAAEVASFLVEHVLPDCEPHAISLRTLHLGYELREANPDEWRELLAAVTSVRGFDGAPEDLVRELAGDASTSIGDQEALFRRATGLSRRSFYHYRRRLGLSRSYEPRGAASASTSDPLTPTQASLPDTA